MFQNPPPPYNPDWKCHEPIPPPYNPDWKCHEPIPPPYNPDWKCHEPIPPPPYNPDDSKIKRDEEKSEKKYDPLYHPLDIKINAAPTNEEEKIVLEIKLQEFVNTLYGYYAAGGSGNVIQYIRHVCPTPADFFKIGRTCYKLKTVRQLCRMIGMNINFAFLANRHYIVYRIYEHKINQEGLPNWREVKFEKSNCSIM
jgi:hypothetical protein